MAREKGHKKQDGYATTASLGGKSYTEIATIMNDRGHKMNHSTAYNLFHRSMKKIATNVCSLYDIEPTEENLRKISCNPDFQEGVSTIIKGF